MELFHRHFAHLSDLHSDTLCSLLSAHLELNAQLLTYLKLSGLKLGLLLNFNVPVMKDGIVRVVNEFKG